MILEHALLPVRPEQAEEFEAAFAEARPIIATMPGFRSLSLSRCIETPDTYLLLVAWERLADHVEGFRGSEGYQRWKQLLHHFYDPFPIVRHFVAVVDDPTPGSPPAVAASTPNRQ
ncbi:antibiotic biosynthesis monooxygenase family protein [Nocardia sp. KC 131]|uniref:antibiotic biosynthesis monooxygenase family protein n=1 Tax=Nocardia arseniciresistens TaxID=3392119 RepID=UPI00398F5361